MYLNREEIWTELFKNDYRKRFFIETWWSLLHLKTPHFYQARYMNSFRLVEEVFEYLNEYYKDDRYLKYLKMSSQEAYETIQKDSYFKKTVGSYEVILVNILNQIRNVKPDQKPDHKELNKLRYICSYVIKYKRIYINTLFQELIKSLTDDIDLDDEKGKKKLLDQINEQTNKILSYLLSDGYSPTYLYNRLKLLTNYKTYEKKTFEEALKNIISRLLSKEDQYTVVQGFKLDSHAKYLLKQKCLCDLEIKLADGSTHEDFGQVDITPALLENADGYFYRNIIANDYITAAWKLQNDIETVKDIITYENKADVLKVSPQCIVIHNNEGLIHPHKVKVETLRKLIIKRTDYYDLKIDTVLFRAIERGNIREDTIASVKRVLRYYRLGILSPSIETRILYMWIALEALIEDSGAAAENSINKFVPKIYAFESLSKRLGYFFDVLRRENIDLSDYVNNSEKIGSEEKIRVAYSISSSESNAQDVYDRCEGKDFVKYLIYEMYNTFKDKKSVRRQVEKSEYDVERQLDRINYIRNKVVHKAFLENVDLRIYLHLCDYVSTVISEMIMALEEAEFKDKTLADVLDSHYLAIDMKYKTWENKKDLTLYDVLYYQPII